MSKGDHLGMVQMVRPHRFAPTPDDRRAKRQDRADREDAVGERRTRLVQRFVHHGAIMLDAGRST